METVYNQLDTAMVTDRRQRVVVGGEVSSWKSVLSGVPQVSVLYGLFYVWCKSMI